MSVEISQADPSYFGEVTIAGDTCCAIVMRCRYRAGWDIFDPLASDVGRRGNYVDGRAMIQGLSCKKHAIRMATRMVEANELTPYS